MRLEGYAARERADRVMLNRFATGVRWHKGGRRGRKAAIARIVALRVRRNLFVVSIHQLLDLRDLPRNLMAFDGLVVEFERQREGELVLAVRNDRCFRGNIQIALWLLDGDGLALRFTCARRRHEDLARCVAGKS